MEDDEARSSAMAVVVHGSPAVVTNSSGSWYHSAPPFELNLKMDPREFDTETGIDVKALLEESNRRVEHWKTAYEHERERYLDYRAWAEREMEAIRTGHRSESSHNSNVIRPRFPERRIGDPPCLRRTPRKRVRLPTTSRRLAPIGEDYDENSQGDEEVRDIQIDEASIRPTEDRHARDHENGNDNSEEEDPEEDPSDIPSD